MSFIILVRLRSSFSSPSWQAKVMAFYGLSFSQCFSFLLRNHEKSARHWVLFRRTLLMFFFRKSKLQKLVFISFFHVFWKFAQNSMEKWKAGREFCIENWSKTEHSQRLHWYRFCMHDKSKRIYCTNGVWRQNTALNVWHSAENSSQYWCLVCKNKMWWKCSCCWRFWNAKMYFGSFRMTRAKK